MTFGIPILLPVTSENFTERGYLDANSDVLEAVKVGQIKSGRSHYEKSGWNEGRNVMMLDKIAESRSQKLKRLQPFLRKDMHRTETKSGKPNYLSAQLIEETKIIPTLAVSAHGYDFEMQDFIKAHAGGLILDCGAGSKASYLEDVVNFEIVDYPSTDVLGVGEMLPFKDNTFDGVMSIAVLEHVRDPFQCAREIARVLKPGGRIYCAVPFLQPYHGYPHHYFNATHQGIQRLFEDYLEIDDVRVVPTTHPIFALNWILSSWCQGLSGDALEDFKEMKIGDFIGDPGQFLAHGFCSALSTEKQKELACGTVLRGKKI